MKKLLIISVFFFVSCHCFSNSISENKRAGDFEKGVLLFNRHCFGQAADLFMNASSLYDSVSAPTFYCKALNQYALSLFWQDKIIECTPGCYNNLLTCQKLLGNNHQETAQAMLNIGACKFASGGHGVVGEYFEQAAIIYENNYGENHPAAAKAYEWLGAFYEGRADTSNARKYLWKSFNIYKSTLGSDHPDLAEIYRYMGLYFKRFSQHDSAVIYFNKSKLLFDKKYGAANFQSVKCLNNLADIYAVHDSLKHLVEPTYELCISLMAKLNSPSRMAKVMTLYNEAEYMRSHGAWESAIENMNKILVYYFPDFQNQDIFQNPKSSSDYAYSIVKLIFLFKAHTFKQWSDVDTLQRITYLMAACDAYKIVDEIMDAMRKNIVNLDDLLLFSGAHAQLYDHMSLVSLQLFGLTRNVEHLNQALRNISKKTMMNQLNQSEEFYMKYADIKPETIEQYKSYNNEINTLQSHYLNQGEREELEVLIINKKIEQDLFFTALAQTHQPSDSPVNFYDKITHTKIREQLADDECLILFSQIKQDHKAIPSHLTIIAINQNKHRVKHIEGDSIFKAIARYNALLATDSPLDEIKTVGEYLYRQLIFPAQDLLNKKIIVIPSPDLNQLSFDALPVPNTGNTSGKGWLIEKYLVRKEFSLVDFIAQGNAPQKSKGDSLLAIVPTFNTEKKQAIAMLARRDTSLINLAGALAECEEITKYFKTNLLSGKKADETSFKAISGNYPFLHISTHGVPFSDNNQAVKLAFCTEPSVNDDGWLNFYEILNLNLNSEMVVLSACKTGIGKTNNGEGSLNLAWAFRQAGAKSVVISLWDVNDFASSEIMPAFYKKIRQGLSRPEALRQAKLHYLQNNDQKAAHPYYWAAFDYIGDAGVESVHGFVWLHKFSLLALLLPSLLLLTIIAIKRIKNA